MTLPTQAAKESKLEVQTQLEETKQELEAARESKLEVETQLEETKQ